MPGLVGDDEDSEAVFIVAADKEKALAWGREIAERFVSGLYQDQTISWKQQNFAAWIEEDWQKLYTSEQLAKISIVQEGEYPAWRQSDG